MNLSTLKPGDIIKVKNIGIVRVKKNFHGERTLWLTSLEESGFYILDYNKIHKYEELKNIIEE